MTEVKVKETLLDVVEKTKSGIMFTPYIPAFSTAVSIEEKIKILKIKDWLQRKKFESTYSTKKVNLKFYQTVVATSDRGFTKE